MIVLAIVPVFVYGMIPSGAADPAADPAKDAETAALKRYFFFHWTTDIMPLSSLDGVGGIENQPGSIAIVECEPRYTF